MPGKKKMGYVRITVQIRPDQKEAIEAEKGERFDATQDSIIRDALDLYFEKENEGNKNK